MPSWNPVQNSGSSSGGSAYSGTQNYIPFAGASGALTESASLQYDDSTKRLHVGTTESIYFEHDQTDATIATTVGDLNLSPAGTNAGGTAPTIRFVNLVEDAYLTFDGGTGNEYIRGTATSMGIFAASTIYLTTAGGGTGVSVTDTQLALGSRDVAGLGASNKVTGTRGWMADFSGDSVVGTSGEHIYSDADDSLKIVAGKTYIYDEATKVADFDSSGINVWGAVFVRTDMRHQDNVEAYFGTSQDAEIAWRTAQTPDSLVIGLGAQSNSVTICEKADTGTDFAHDNSAGNPTLYIQSADATTIADWISFAHDQTNGVIATGAGDLTLSPASGVVGGITGAITGTRTWMVDLSGDSVAQTSGEHMLSPSDGYIDVHTDSGFRFYDGTNIKWDFSANLAQFYAELRMRDGIKISFGTGSDATIGYWTQITPDSWVFGVPATSNGMIIAEKASAAYDWAHPLQVNPTLWVQSATQSTTQWLSLAHDQSSGVIATGAGDLTLSPASGVVGGITGAISGTRTWMADFSGDSVVGVSGEHIYSPGDGQLEIWAGGRAVQFNAGTIQVYDKLEMQDNIRLSFGTSGDVEMFYGTAQTPDALMIGVSAQSKAITICDVADIGTDFAHDNSAGNPTLYIQSADETTVAQWVALQHNQSGGVIATGAGSLFLNPADDIIDVGSAQIVGVATKISGTRTWMVDFSGDSVLGTSGEHIYSPSDNGVNYYSGLEHTFYCAGAERVQFSGSAVDVTASMTFKDNYYARWGNGNDAVIGWRTGQTPDSLMFGLSGSNAVTICEVADIGTDFAHSATNPTLFIQSADAATIAEWASLNYASLFLYEAAAAEADVAAHGQLWVLNEAPNVGMFTDDSGVDHRISTPPHGEIYLHDGSTAQTLTTQGTFYKLTGFTTNGTSYKATNDVASDRIQVLTAGTYKVEFNISFSGSISATFEISVFAGASGALTEQTNVTLERKLGTGGDVGTGSAGGLLDLAANDYVELHATCTSGASKDITPHHLNLRIVEVQYG